MDKTLLAAKAIEVAFTIAPDWRDANATAGGLVNSN
jgi:hypothetical protein